MVVANRVIGRSDRFQRRLSSQEGRAMAGTSRVNREVYARFCGRLEVKFLRPTRRRLQVGSGIRSGTLGVALGRRRCRVLLPALSATLRNGVVALETLLILGGGFCFVAHVSLPR